MIGIDIVDHRDPLLRKRDERAFRLIRHEHDSHIGIDIPEEHLFWLYWAAKESVYKAKRQLRRFDPKLIQVALFKNENDFHFTSANISGKISQNSKYTLSVCSEIALDATLYEAFESSKKDQSKEIRSLMIQTLELSLKCDAKNTIDEMGLPAVLINNKLHPATFTHHYHMMGFICTR